MPNPLTKPFALVAAALFLLSPLAAHAQETSPSPPSSRFWARSSPRRRNFQKKTSRSPKAKTRTLSPNWFQPRAIKLDWNSPSSWTKPTTLLLAAIWAT